MSESRLLIQKLTVDSQKSDSQRLYLQTTISSLREQLRLKQEAEEPLHFNIQSLKEELERLKFKDHEEKIYIQSLQDELLASERMSRATGNVDYYYNHKANRLGGDVAGNISPDIIGKVSDKSTSFEETRPYANNVGNYHHHPHTFKSSSPKKHDAPDNYHHRPQQHRHQHHQLLNDKASSSPSRAYTSSPNKSPLKKTSAVQQDNYYSSFEEDLGGFQGEDANLSSSPNSSKVVDTTAMWMEREKAYTEDVMTKFSKQISRLK